MMGDSGRHYRHIARCLRGGIVCALVLLAIAPSVRAAVDSEALATRIAESLQNTLRDSRYRTVAISRIREAKSGVDIDELIDLINVKIVRGRKFQVVDRSRLQLILREQKIQLSDFVSAEKYQELGKLMGVDLFIYGTFHGDGLVLKGIDVQNSAIAWADLFLFAHTPVTNFLSGLGQNVVTSIGKDLDRLRKAKVKLVSFWDINADSPFTSSAVMDYLSIALTQGGHFQVVDRENLRLITEEQKLNQEVFIDEKNAKRLGELYGVDAFIYGGITRRDKDTYRASLKLLNIYTGVIEWADLITMSNRNPGGGPAFKPSSGPPGMAHIGEGEFLMGDKDASRVNGPEHEVRLPTYFIDLTEVSNREYMASIKARNYRQPVGWNAGPPPGKEDHPVVGVSWEDARRYCQHVGKRLPTEAEWEKAARGTSDQPYPWEGRVFSPGFTVTRESGQKQSSPVDQSAARDVSPFGVKNMAGNVREWVEDLYQPYKGGRGSDEKFGRERVVRGGSWATDQQAAAVYFRGSSNPNLAWPDVGFRCAKSLP